MPGDRDPVIGADELLAQARSGLTRVTPAEAMTESADGAVIVDIRPLEQRDRDGALPGAEVICRNVLEWRLDPGCEHRNPDLARSGARVILVCDEGYQSSLAAANLRRFDLDATDVIGGFQAWLADGLPVNRSAA
jgi:rhodanese-related sulfurtransferase